MHYYIGRHLEFMPLRFMFHLCIWVLENILQGYNYLNSLNLLTNSLGIKMINNIFYDASFSAFVAIFLTSHFIVRA